MVRKKSNMVTTYLSPIMLEFVKEFYVSFLEQTMSKKGMDGLFNAFLGIQNKGFLSINLQILINWLCILQNKLIIRARIVLFSNVLRHIQMLFLLFLWLLRSRYAISYFSEIIIFEKITFLKFVI